MLGCETPTSLAAPDVAAAFRNGDGIVQLSQSGSHNFFRGFCV